MTTKTEGKHTEEFLIREGNGDISREVATVTSGQILVDGQVVKFSAGKLVAAAGTIDSAHDSTEDIAGIVLGNWDASASGTNADITGVPYIARLATVKLSAVKLYTASADANKTAAVKAALAAAFIITR